jgi:hypothetical protein
MPELQLLRAWIATMRTRMRGDAGSPTLETVIIAGVLAAAAIAATAYLVSRIVSHTNGIQ